MKNRNDKFSWLTRLKFCWTLLTRGTYNPKDYKTIHEQKEWDACRKRDKEMNKCVRPRTNTGQGQSKANKSQVSYTDYFESS